MKSSKITPEILQRAYATVTRFASKRGLTRAADYDTLADWDGVAHEALMRAERTYSPGLSSFSTWSTRMIMQELRAYVTVNAGRTVSIPREAASLGGRIQRIREDLLKALLRPPTNVELAEACGLDGQGLSDAMSEYFAHHTRCDTSGEGYQLVDEAASLEDALYVQALCGLALDALLAAAAVGDVHEQAYHVVRLLYSSGCGAPVTQEEVAAHLGVSQAEVSKYNQAGICFLKQRFGGAER